MSQCESRDCVGDRMPKNGELVLNSGRQIYLRSLKQWEFYEGLLEGLPTVEMNRRRLERIVAEHRVPYGEPFVIQPDEKPIEYTGGRYPFGTPAAFPGIACVGRFDSLSPVGDRDKDFSGLVVIWFQQDFAFPIARDVVEELQRLAWESLALDMEY